MKTELSGAKKQKLIRPDRVTRTLDNRTLCGQINDGLLIHENSGSNSESNKSVLKVNRFLIDPEEGLDDCVRGNKRILLDHKFLLLVFTLV